MDVFNPDTWKQQWAIFLSAPYIIVPPVIIVAIIVWWFRGTMFQPTIAGLKGEIKVLGAQKTIFDSQMQIAAREMALERSRQDRFARQINDLKDDTAKIGNDALATRIRRLEIEFSELVAASNAVNSAIAAAVGETGRLNIVGNPAVLHVHRTNGTEESK